MSQAKHLYDLQQIDLDIERATDAQRQIQDQLSDKSELLTAKEKLDQLKSQLQELHKKQQKAEWEIDDLRSKSEPLKKKLYGGSVKSPKELVGMQQELDLLNKRISEKEDSALELMAEIEAMQGKTDECSQEFKKLEKQRQEKEEALLAKKTDLEGQLSRSEARRAPLAGTIDNVSLNLYEHLRTGRRRPTVAKVEQGRCQGCRITLPLNKLQQIRTRNELVQCDSCERILFLE